MKVHFLVAKLLNLKALQVVMLCAVSSVAYTAEQIHFVAFRFKAETPEETIKEVVNRFVSLKKACKYKNKRYIKSIKAGVANSEEGFDQGFTHGFLIVFNRIQERDYYVWEDPCHTAFKKFTAPFLSTDASGKINGVFGFDFEPGSIVE